MNKPFRLVAALLMMGIVSVALVACGSGGAKVVAPQDTEAPAEAAVETTEPEMADNLASVPDPADTTTESSVETTKMTTEPKDEPVVVEKTDTTTDVVNESPETESAVQTFYSDYGFALKLDLGAEIQAAGWTEAEANETQGIIAFTYGGVNTNLVWGPQEDRANLTFLADTYNILRASQPSVTFESISEGDISISEQEGVYGGFKAVSDGASIGGGLIGAWTCGDSDTAFRMTLTGEDATVVQLRFDRLLENFACSSS